VCGPQQIWWTHWDRGESCGPRKKAAPAEEEKKKPEREEKEQQATAKEKAVAKLADDDYDDFSDEHELTAITQATGIVKAIVAEKMQSSHGLLAWGII